MAMYAIFEVSLGTELVTSTDIDLRMGNPLFYCVHVSNCCGDVINFYVLLLVGGKEM